MAPTESDDAKGGAEVAVASPPQPPAQSLMNTPQATLDEWVENVDETHQQINDILNGTITDFDEFDRQQNLKQRAKEIKVEEFAEKKERFFLYGVSGKGEGKNYKWWCKRCFVEYRIDLQDNKCTRCDQADKMMTPEGRREELMGKLEGFKEVKVKHQWRKDKWLRGRSPRRCSGAAATSITRPGSIGSQTQSLTRRVIPSSLKTIPSSLRWRWT